MYNRNNTQKSPQKRFLLVLGLAVVLCYYVMGFGAIFWTDMAILRELQPVYRNALGVILIVYATIRLVRINQLRIQEDE